MTTLLALLGMSIQGQPRLQTQTFINPSFEGKPASPFDMDTWGIIPPMWKTCVSGSTPDSQPGAWGVDTPPSDGKSYVAIICRKDGSYEDIAQNLSVPLKKDKNYCLTLDMAFNENETSTGPRQPNILRIRGASAGCTQKDILWTSPLITHKEWRKYEVCFTAKQDYEALDFESYYDGSFIYNGRILLDNLSPLETVEDFQMSICTGDSSLASALPVGEKLSDWQITWKAGKNLKADVMSESIWVKSSGEYNIELKKGSRTYTSNLTVTASECESVFLIPNLFTPNGDDHNETFAIRGIFPNKWKLNIYDRWGTQVYKSQGYNNEWAGEAGETGIYYYYLQDTESERKYTGFVNVIR